MGNVAPEMDEESDQKYHRSEERSHWAHEHAHNKRVACLSAIAAGAAFVAAVAAVGAYIQTKRQAEAAETQIGVAKDTEQRQLRAYIGVVPPADNQVINSFFPPIAPDVRLTPKNFGVTPAYKAQHHTGMGIYPYPIPKDFAYPLETPITPPNPITIYPGALDIAGIIAQSRRPLTQEEIASIQTGRTMRLYVWGTITYEDVLGSRHFTNFCISFFDLMPARVRREPCNDHNDSD